MADSEYASLPAAILAHSLPGRHRLRVPGRRGDQPWFVRVAKVLGSLHGVHAVKINPHSGSLLILSEPTLAAELLERVGRERGLYRLVTAQAAARPAPRTLAEHAGYWLQRRERALLEASGGYLDWRTVVFVAMSGMAVHQWRQGHLFAPAVTLLWHAGELLRFPEARPDERDV